ncbi:hypothetical protein ACOSQ3_010276 [Xanthoceras sorbifolium]
MTDSVGRVSSISGVGSLGLVASSSGISTASGSRRSGAIVCGGPADGDVLGGHSVSVFKPTASFALCGLSVNRGVLGPGGYFLVGSIVVLHGLWVGERMGVGPEVNNGLGVLGPVRGRLEVVRYAETVADYGGAFWYFLIVTAANPKRLCVGEGRVLEPAADFILGGLSSGGGGLEAAVCAGTIVECGGAAEDFFIATAANSGGLYASEMGVLESAAGSGLGVVNGVFGAAATSGCGVAASFTGGAGSCSYVPRPNSLRYEESRAFA